SGDSGDDDQSAEEQNATDAKDESVDASGEDEVPEDTPSQETEAAAKAEKKAEKPAPKKSSSNESADAVPPRAEPAGAAKSGSSPYVTPLVRKLAQEHGVDLDSVKGTGIGGRIRKQDVLAAAEGAGTDSGSEAPAQKKAPAGGPSTAGVRPELAELRGTTKKANRIRKITAQKTRESLQTSAQLTQVFEVDMTRVAQLRSKVKEQFADKHGVKLTYLPFYAKAVVEALVSHPNVNASYDESSNEITYHGSVNLGIAVDTEAGLLSPVIHNAQDLDIPGLAKAIIDIAERARASKLTPDDLQGGTFTITNIGSEGALFDTPILVPPQAAMLGTGAIVRRPVVDADADGESIAIRSMGFMPMTYDHRLIDGADAGRFLTTVKDRLEKAEFEGDLGL
ncbi:dihydrolipoamide acetyltransferase, partial [Dietzia cinnamea P4]